MISLEKTLEAFGSAIITGASSGIGRALLDELVAADPGFKVWTISRTKPEIRTWVPAVQHISADLSDPEVVKRAFYSLANSDDFQSNSNPVLLINNAGFGVYGRFDASQLERSLSMIDLNIRALVQGTGILWETLQKRGGAVVNIASTASFQPSPHMAAYGATKAFVLNWTTALHEELRQSGAYPRTRALCVCPGPTETNFFSAAGLAGGAPESTKFLNETSSDVAATVWKALAKKRGPIVVSGWKNKLLTSLASPFPTALKARVAAAVLKAWRADN
ncbi:MAG: SDR family NAD(P)-dependent oxidoreductase [Opitutales bacterium]|nr:SDR family NAD(P)-dependent oxidoreductase [Opitutales bacterium]NRA27138.1 SDR family NAD(P)-dependent oxidoreductase [Opitutales bacterium]